MMSRALRAGTSLAAALLIGMPAVLAQDAPPSPAQTESRTASLLTAVQASVDARVDGYRSVEPVEANSHDGAARLVYVDHALMRLHKPLAAMKPARRAAMPASDSVDLPEPKVLLLTSLGGLALFVLLRGVYAHTDTGIGERRQRGASPPRPVRSRPPQLAAARRRPASA